MKAIYLLLVSIVIYSASTEAAECEIGWTAFKDEQCFKIFTDLLTYDEAIDFCSSQGSVDVKASILMIKEEDMQEILDSYTQDVHDHFWLGGRFDNTTEQFKWEDGDVMTYTNWQEGSPGNIDSDSGSCIEMRPNNSRLMTNSNGQWVNVSCQKRNLVICQKTFSWTLQDAINEIIRIREELVATQDKLQVTEENLQIVSSNVVPVGSVYIQYQNQPSPADLWPSLMWEDISNHYAGLFFRAAGDDAASWGITQEACAPRITHMDFTYTGKVSMVRNPLYLPSSGGWSEYGWTGVHSRNTNSNKNRNENNMYEGLRFYSESCEVRPRNQAIRIWKRVA